MEAVANKSVFVVQKPFTFAGKDLKVGDVFDWRKLGCPERRLEQLRSSRRVGVRELPKAKEPAAK